MSVKARTAGERRRAESLARRLPHRPGEEATHPGTGWDKLCEFGAERVLNGGRFSAG